MKRDAVYPAVTGAAPSLSVIVFAYNEAENIAPVLGELQAWLALHEPNAELVFIDDGSRDDTLERARTALAGARAKFLRHESNRGIGAALKTAVRACEAPWVTFLPADGQIEPRAIATLRAAASGGDTDVVFSTYAARDDGLHRKLFSFGVRALICERSANCRSLRAGRKKPGTEGSTRGLRRSGWKRAD